MEIFNSNQQIYLPLSVLTVQASNLSTLTSKQSGSYVKDTGLGSANATAVFVSCRSTMGQLWMQKLRLPHTVWSRSEYVFYACLLPGTSSQFPLSGVGQNMVFHAQPATRNGFSVFIVWSRSEYGFTCFACYQERLLSYYLPSPLQFILTPILFKDKNDML